MFQRRSFVPSNQKRGPKTRVGCFIKRCSTQQLKLSVVRNVAPLYIDSTRLLLNDDIALANEREIKISNIGWDSPPYTDESWYILADVIRTTTSLEKVCFEKDTVIALQNRYVVEALANNLTIKTLDLTGAGCGNAGAKAVAAVLKENAAIEEVKFNANNISNEGAKAVADAVKHNFTLQTIDLGSNEIGAEGAKALAEALRENTAALRKLNIAYNNIGEGGGKHVLNALRQMKSSTKYSGPTIETIDVSGNRLTNETKQQIYQEVNRVQYRLSIVGANKGRAPAAGMTQRLNDGVREDSMTAVNIRPMGRGRAATLPAWMTRQGDRVPTIHANNSSKVDGVAEEVQETTKVQQTISDADKVKELQSMYNAMENKVKQLQLTIAQQQDKLAQRDEDIAQKDKKIATMRMERSQGLGEQRSRCAAQRFTIEKLHGKIAEQDKQIASMRTQRPHMAQEPDGHEVESDDLETYTRCCVCLEPYEAEPNSLGSQRLPIKSATCAHSLCEDCLGRYHASLMNGRSTVRYVRCPQCNDKTKKAFDIQNKVVDVFLREYIQCRKRKRSA